MKIGTLEIKDPYCLAPLAGITDASFRRLCHTYGCGLVFSEMISAKGIYYKDKGSERLLRIYEDEAPIAYQLFGSDPDILGEVVASLEYRPNAMIDFNMGCPVPKVVRNGEGSALLKEPKLVEKLVTAMVNATRKPVTVKIRIGWDEDSINGVEIGKIIESAGASALVVHGRTRSQYYQGKADWAAIKSIKENLSIPVIGNGDVFTLKEAKEKMNQSGCDGIMIGRGALGNPWIFKQLTEGVEPPYEPTFQERKKVALKHLDLVIADKGETVGIKEMRKHFAWYFKGFPKAAQVRNEINRISDKNQLIHYIEELLL